MIHQSKAFLRNNLNEWNLPTSGEWKFLLNNNYHPHCSNFNLLWFHEKDEFPRVVAKLYLSDEGIAKREFGNLAEAHRCAPAWIPRPYYIGRMGPFWTWWMEGVPGSPVPAGGKVRPRILHSMVETVAAVHVAIREQRQPLKPGRRQRMVSEPLEAVANFGEIESVRQGCAHLLEITSDQWVEGIPVIPQHGDLVSINILVHNETWHIIDWESFGIVDFPFYDLLTLLFSLSSGGTPNTWNLDFVKQVPSLVSAYAARLGITTNDLDRLLPLTLANWFYLHWCDGRKEFAGRMYRTIQHYFEHNELWQRLFSGKSR